MSKSLSAAPLNGKPSQSGPMKTDFLSTVITKAQKYSPLSSAAADSRGMDSFIIFLPNPAWAA